MPYAIEVLYSHKPEWQAYQQYWTLAEAMRQFHRLETHDACANVRLMHEGQAVVTAR